MRQARLLPALTLDTVATTSEARESMSRVAYDLVVADFYLESGTSEQFVRDLRTRDGSVCGREL